MEQEEKRFIKWVAILIACIVAAVVTAILVFVYCPTETKRAAENEVQPLPEQITFTAEQLNVAARNGGTTSVTVRANVEPYNAENTKVDFTVAWTLRHHIPRMLPSMLRFGKTATAVRPQRSPA